MVILAPRADRLLSTPSRLMLIRWCSRGNRFRNSLSGPPPTEPTSRSGARSLSKSPTITERESESISACDANDASIKRFPSTFRNSLFGSKALRLSPRFGISNVFVQNSPAAESIFPSGSILHVRSNGCDTTALHRQVHPSGFWRSKLRKPVVAYRSSNPSPSKSINAGA